MALYAKRDKNKKKIRDKDGQEIWYFRDYYTDMYGNRKQYKSGCFAGKKIAEEAERKWLDNINKKEQNIENIDFIKVYEEWLFLKAKKVKETTYSGIYYRANRYIKPFFEKYKLHSIKTNIIDNWYKELDKTNITSIEYKNIIVSVLKEILEYSRDNYCFDNKILSKIITYRNDNPIKQSDAEKNFWTYDEWKTFINFVDNYEYKVMFTFLYYTGLRFGEFSALNWHDYNSDKATISITKSLSNKVVGKKYIIQSPKTENSIRVVDLDNRLNKMLIEYKQYKKNKCYNFSDNDYIFGDIKYIAPTTFRRCLNDYIKKVQNTDSTFKRITIHGFRHSHVSLLIHLGCDSRDVAERIGDTVQMIEKTYYHMFPKKKKDTLNKLNNLEK